MLFDYKFTNPSLTIHNIVMVMVSCSIYIIAVWKRMFMTVVKFFLLCNVQTHTRAKKQVARLSPENSCVVVAIAVESQWNGSNGIFIHSYNC